MMTTPNEPVSRGGRRALYRLGLRTARKNRLRSLLIVLLIAAPVAASIVVAGGNRALNPSAEVQRSWEIGKADWFVEIWGPNALGSPISIDDVGVYPEGLSVEDLAALESSLAWRSSTSVAEVRDLLADAFGTDDLLVEQRNGYLLDGDYVEVSSLDASTDLASGIYRFEEGAPAGRAGEVSVSEQLASRLGVGLGDSLDLRDGSKAVVAGIHRTSRRVAGLSLLDPTTTADTNGSIRFLLGGVSDAQGQAGYDRFGSAVDQQGGAGTFSGMQQFGNLNISSADSYFGWDNSAPLQLDKPPVLSGVVAALLLLEVALIAAAAFSTGARRRLREFGLLSTIGAEPQHIRQLVVAEAAILGTTGAALGAVLGLALTQAMAPVLRSLTSNRLDAATNSPADIIGPVLVGVLASVAAAWIPARTASNVAPLTALTGRMPVRKLKHRVAPLAAVLVGVGLLVVGATATSMRTSYGNNDGEILAITFGCLLCLAGASLGASWVLEQVSRAGDRLPLGLRLVARDAARQRFRSASAVAGLVVVMAAPVITVAAVLSESGSNEPSTQEALPDEVILTTYVGDQGTQASAPARSEKLKRIGEILPGSTTGEIEVLGLLLEFGEQELYAGSLQPAAGEENVYVGGGSVALGTTEAVAALRLPPAAATALANGQVVALSAAGPSSIDYAATDAAWNGQGPWSSIEFEAVQMGNRKSTWLAPEYLIPPQMASEYGFETIRVLDIVVAASPLTDQQRKALSNPDSPTGQGLRFLDGSNGGLGDVNVAWADGGVNLAPLTIAQLIALPITAIIVLIVGGCLVAIAATESDHDIATMVRVGASPSLRKRFLGLQSWYHALLGALLGAPIGLLLLVALRQALSNPAPVRVPWLSLAVVVIGIPLVLAMVIGLVVRSRPPKPTLL